MQKSIKIALFTFYAITVVCMAAATIIEKYEGHHFVASNIYGAWWFSMLWTILAATGTTCFLKHRPKTFTGIILHLSFIVILAGAFITHISSERGIVHLRKGHPTTTYSVYDNNMNLQEKTLPFEMRLDSFFVKYHSGTDAAQDYVSQFTIAKDGKQTCGEVSMNNIFSYDDMRFYQNSYDNDMLGATLSINSDPVGIPVTYAGYALLFASLILMLLNPKGAYRKLLKSELLKKGALIVAMTLVLGTTNANAENKTPPSTTEVGTKTLPKETAAKFGKLNIVYNNRICPVQTFAIDFIQKLYGARSYKGLTPEQVVTGWIFWGEAWMDEPILRIKDGKIKEVLQLADCVSANDFFKDETEGYAIGTYIKEYYEGNHDKLHTQAASIDDKIQLLMDLRRGLLLKIFPNTQNGKTTWYAPTEDLPESMEYAKKQFIQTVFTILFDDAEAKRFGKMDETIGKIENYQKENGGTSLPNESQTEAEFAYNKTPFATILFIVCLTMGLLTYLYTVTRLCRQCRLVNDKDSRAGYKSLADTIITGVSYATMLACFATLSYCEYLRWTISGTLPMANGYETMLLVAWITLLSALVLSLRFRIMLTYGFIMSGFFLLVSHINQMDPQINYIMPVLNSPLLSMHVSIIMTAFALLSFTFINAVTAIIVRLINRKADTIMLALQQLSVLFLYPAVTALGIGIFTGAVWANVSWGQYWGWDPKEVWALITFMVYAAALHPRMLPTLRRPLHFHVFMLLAFLTIIITCFGVNYFLGGMHSYA